jgi:hypothetical protein
MAFAFATYHADLFDRLDDEVRLAPAPALGLLIQPDAAVAVCCDNFA